MSLTDEEKHWITERMRAMETAILTEFHKWASPNEARQRSHTAAIRAMDLELEGPAEPDSNL